MEVSLFLGPENGEKTPAVWQQEKKLGLRDSGEFSTVVKNLEEGRTYFFRFFATNAEGTVWTTSSGFFATPRAWVKAIAHRGDSLYAPENTLAAFVSAFGKADMIEFDVQQSKDGVLVVIHDASVDRTTDGNGQVINLTLQQLQALDAGYPRKFGTAFAGERIPTLEQVLQAIPPSITPVIDCKAPLPQKYVQSIQALNRSTGVILISSDLSFLTAVRSLDARIRLGLVGTGPIPLASLAGYRAAGMEYLVWNNMTRSEINAIHAAGLQAIIWTINTADAARQFIEMGVDGIISDNPELIATAVQADTDGDSMTDAWEVRTFGSISIGNLLTDSDGDGRLDFAEFRAGTDPLNPRSVLQISTCLSIDSENAIISWEGHSGRFYSIWTCSNLWSGWEPVATLIPGNDGRQTLTSRLDNVAMRLFKIGVHN